MSTASALARSSEQLSTPGDSRTLHAEEEEEEPSLDGALNFLLRDCAKWWRVVAGRTNPAWAFMAPDNDVFEKASDGGSVPKEHSVTCWLCHYRYEGELLNSYPCKDDDDDFHVHARTVLHMQSLPADTVDINRRPKYQFTYKTSSASTILRQHCIKNHPAEYDQLVIGAAPKAATKRSLSQDTRKTCASTVSNAFRSVKKLRTDHPRQELFHRLISYVIIMMKWSFSVLDNAWFRALVWFLDPSIAIPSRGTLMSSLLPGIVKDTYSDVMLRLSDVGGGTLLFDLWQSRKGTCAF